MRILVVEDEPVLRAQLAQAIAAAGHTVDSVADGAQAHYLGEVEDFDAVVLDLGLPVLDGLSVLRRWRTAGRNMPVLILTARSAWQEKVAGIDAGADDYLAKPFDFRELEARCRALLRRPSAQAAGVQRFGDLVIDSAARLLTLAGQRIELPKREYSLLEILLAGMNRAVSKDEIANKLFAFDDDAAPNAIEVYIARLRRKLEGSPLRIETRRGTGYILTCSDDGKPDAPAGG